MVEPREDYSNAQKSINEPIHLKELITDAAKDFSLDAITQGNRPVTLKKLWETSHFQIKSDLPKERRG